MMFVQSDQILHCPLTERAFCRNYLIEKTLTKGHFFQVFLKLNEMYTFLGGNRQIQLLNSVGVIYCSIIWRQTLRAQLFKTKDVVS